jgi:tetratricopeptide (TPR) repeat protein
MAAEQLGNGEATILRKQTSRRLNGWKEIGAYFQKNERTVKRWEQRGLPVHRLPGGAKTAVFAYADELEVWLNRSRSLAQAEVPEQETPPTHPSPTQPQTRSGWRRRYVMIGLAVSTLALASGASAFFGWTGLVDRTPALAIAHHQPGAAASQLYLSGLYHWNTRSPEGLKQSLEEFRQAVRLEPNFAAAHAGLGNAYNLLAQYGVMKPGEAYPLAKSAAEQAIALDPKLADGYSALGFASFYGFKDLRRSEALFQQALALDPNSSRTFHWYALIMMHTGKFDEPLRAITRAQELDPDSHAIRANRGLILFYAGRTDEAISVLTDLTKSAPAFLSPHYYLATIYLDQQRYEDFLRESLEAAELENNAALKAEIESASAGYKAGGLKGLLSALLAAQKNALAAGDGVAFNAARTAALLGDSDAAFALLAQSQSAGEPDLLGIRIDRGFKTLRSDPRFQKLAASVLALQ